MKIKSIILTLISISGTSVFAGGISSGTPPTRQLIQCSDAEGSETAAVSEENGKIFGYVVTKSGIIGPEKLTFKSPEAQGTPVEKPLTYKGKNMKVEIYLTNQPVQEGQIVERPGTISAKVNGKNIKSSLLCKLFP